ncbi:hypothetical protein BD413DRAFT_541129 [Trametes elegans]|nr:hypothetical protein BD413DRAFT_541129 [Trametes elegans]
MGDALSSPDRATPVTKTYAGRQKRRRDSVVNYKDESSSEEDEQQGENPKSSPVKRTASEKMSAKSPKNPSPKKVDVHLPGPSPKRLQASESASAKKPVSRARRGAHARAGSVASINREDTLDANEVSPAKPLSSASTKPRSQATQRIEVAEDGADDRSSIAESSKARSRKTEAERRQFLEEDPNTGEVQAHRVFCKACDAWVDLNPKLRFIMRLWLEHKKQCKNAVTESPSKAKTDQEPKVGEGAAEDDAVSVAATSVADGHRRVAKEEDRKAILEADPRIGDVKPDSAFCKDCEKWIRLSTNTRYSLYHWRVHAQKCSSGVSSPSSRVTTAQRKLKLVNDPHMKSFTPRSVDCKLCDATIELDKSGEYDLTKWEEHKSTAHSTETTTSTETAEAATKATEVASTGSPRPPPSNASTEDTVVATETAPPFRGTKRLREDDEEPDRAAVRPRGASYEPPEGDSPGFLGWIAAPLKNFLRGFREGLSG